MENVIKTWNVQASAPIPCCNQSHSCGAGR